jgi:hypothetical protein
MPQGSVTRSRLSQPGVPQAQPLLAPNWFLGLVPREFWNVYKTFFVYELDFATANGISTQGNGGPALPANGTLTGSVQIQDDSHFLVIGGTAIVTTTDNLTLVFGSGATTPSQKLIQVVDGATGQPLSNVLVPLDNMFGYGILPAVWAIPKLFDKGGAITCTVVNLNTVTAHQVRLSFWGVRIYPNKPME